MSEDDRAVMERLAALEQEVKADADAQRARKDAATAKVREQRAAQEAARDDLRTRQAALVTKKKPAARAAVTASEDDEDGDDGLGSALALAKRANSVKQELSRAPKSGEKSWVKSGVASMVLGPIGWLYAGSLREAVPGAAAWLAFCAFVMKVGLPGLLLWPILMLSVPISGIAGVIYAVQYNRKGSRQRLFDKDKTKKPKQLERG